MNQNLTYRQLLAALMELTDEQLDTTATVYDTASCEVFAVSETTLMSELPTKHRHKIEDMLDYDAPLIII
jgi:hypothetical protein